MLQLLRQFLKRDLALLVVLKVESLKERKDQEEEKTILLNSVWPNFYNLLSSNWPELSIYIIIAISFCPSVCLFERL